MQMRGKVGDPDDQLLETVVRDLELLLKVNVCIILIN